MRKLLALLIFPMIIGGGGEKPPVEPPKLPPLEQSVLDFVNGSSEFVLNAQSGIRPGTRICTSVPDNKRGIVEVTVFIDRWADAGTFDAFGIELVYEPAKLRFDNIAFVHPAMNKDWFFLGNEVMDGIIRIGGASNVNVDPETGALCTIQFLGTDDTAGVFIGTLTDDFSKSKIALVCRG